MTVPREFIPDSKPLSFLHGDLYSGSIALNGRITLGDLPSWQKLLKLKKASLKN